MARIRSQIPDPVNFRSGSLSLVISGDWRKYAAHIIKPTQTGTNRNKYKFCIIKSSGPPKNLNTIRVPVDFILIIKGPEHRRKKVEEILLTNLSTIPLFPPWCSRLKHLCLAACPNIDGDEVCMYLRFPQALSPQIILGSRDGILERHFLSRFLGMNSSHLRVEFLSGFLPLIFPFYKMLFMNRLELSCFLSIIRLV